MIDKLLLLAFLCCFGCSKNENLKTTYNYKTPRFIVKDANFSYNNRAESTPVVLNGKLYDILSNQNNALRTIDIFDDETKQLISSTDLQIMYASALVFQNEIYIYGTSNWEVSAPLIIYKSSDMINFRQVGSLIPHSSRRIFNSSMLHNGNKFIVAVEEDESGGTYFFPNFYESTDLVNWTKISELRFTSYIACPTLKYINGNYYVFYLLSDKASNVYYTSISKSADLVNWTQSGKVVVAPLDESEGQNNSDFDLTEHNGRVIINFAYGNQDQNKGAWQNIKKATYSGSMEMFVNEFF